MNRQLAAFALVFLFMGCTAGEETVRIGAILSLTGDAADIGESLRDSIQLAYDGMDKTRFELRFEDDAATPARTVAAFNKLVHQGGADAVICAWSNTCNAIAPLAEENGVILFAIATDPAIVDGRRHVFKHWIPVERQAEAWVAEAQRRGVDHVAFIAANQQGTLAARDAITALAPEDMAFTQFVVEPGDRDFRTIAAKIPRHTDVIQLSLLPGQTMLAVEQLRELGIDTQLSSVESFAYEDDPQNLLDGAWNVNAKDPKPGFVRAFEERYGRTPLIASGNAYDIMTLLAYAFNGTQDTNSALEALYGAKGLVGVMGALTIDGNGSVLSDAAVYESVNGTWVTS